ncbi:hypothetical protein VFPPC_17354 [Pochonia chlamydosporia 170]|uniref:Uncharacterized protein n=1 Tax=Pochonia chlamydosporia 170 TaxID=1380566 RepID=A0A219ARW6_METCM|nr:hypothetical protein VFPPC_17354 [Pochonia chlamydosporia 170]OWT43497.1 hypothetical protein VFPPC_17354 [Pochonia chlamydosporia 170]
MVQVVMPSKTVDTDPKLLRALKADSETLQEISDNFTPLIKQFRAYLFWEQEKTSLGVTLDYVRPFLSRVVTESLAAPILDNTDRAGLRADHANICKFVSRNAPRYRLVVLTMIRYSLDAPSTIS